MTLFRQYLPIFLHACAIFEESLKASSEETSLDFQGVENLDLVQEELRECLRTPAHGLKIFSRGFVQ